MPDQLAGEHEQDDRLELSQQIFVNPAVTMFFRVPDDSMKSIKVCPGDMLVVDHSLAPRDGQFVVVVINGEQVVRQAIVHDEEVFIKTSSEAGEFMRIGVPSAELIGVAKAFIPVIAEQDSSLSNLEVFMSDPNPSQPLRFVVLSAMNSYGRVIVGVEGEIFTLGWKAVQVLAGLHLVDRATAAGTFRLSDHQVLDIKVTLRIPPPFTVAVWSEPLLGVLTVCAYNRSERAWYLWTPVG